MILVHLQLISVSSRSMKHEDKHSNFLSLSRFSDVDKKYMKNEAQLYFYE